MVLDEKEIKVSLLEKINRRRIGGNHLDTAGPITPTKPRQISTVA